MKHINEILSNLVGKEGEDPIYHCPLCKDVGYILEGNISKRCSCRFDQDMKLRKKRMGITPHMMKMTFENFDISVYSSEKKTRGGITYAEAAKRLVADSKAFIYEVMAGEECSGLFIQGDVGCGKTYVAAAIANALAENGIETKFIVLPDFLDSLRRTYQDDSDVSEHELMKEIKEVPILILDDLGAHNYTDWSVNILYNIINYRINYELPIVATSNLKIDEIDIRIGSRITSRLMESCRFYQLYADVDIRKILRMRKTR